MRAEQHHSQQPRGRNGLNAHRQRKEDKEGELRVRTEILPGHKKRAAMPFAATWVEIAVKRRERQRRKGNGEKEKFHLNAEFQRIVRRYKKTLRPMQRNRGKQ